MGKLHYPGAPTFEYNDEVLATLQSIIAVQQKMGQGFWLERRGQDDNLDRVLHDAVWIDPKMHIRVEFDGLEAPTGSKKLLDEWKMLLTVHGADRLILKPADGRLKVLQKFMDDNGYESLIDPEDA
jgi:hypothetical protein